MALAYNDDRYTTQMIPSMVAHTSLEAKYPQLRNGLVELCSPCVSDHAGANGTAGMMNYRDAGHDYRPIGGNRLSWNETGTCWYSGVWGESPGRRIGAAVASGVDGSASGHIFASSAGNHKIAPPMTVQAVVYVGGTLSGNGDIWTSNGRGTTKAGGKRKGHHLYMDHVNKDIKFRAHDGTTGTLNNGGGFSTPNNTYTTYSAYNIIVTTDSEPIDQSNAHIWVNGVDQSLTFSGNHMVAANDTQVPILLGDRFGIYARNLTLAHFCIWDRVLSDEEIEFISDDPVALYRKSPQATSFIYPPWHLGPAEKIVSLGGVYQTDKIVLAG